MTNQKLKKIVVSTIIDKRPKWTLTTDIEILISINNLFLRQFYGTKNVGLVFTFL